MNSIFEKKTGYEMIIFYHFIFILESNKNPAFSINDLTCILVYLLKNLKKINENQLRNCG